MYHIYCGIRFIELTGCPIGKTYENCSDTSETTRLSDDVVKYRHIGYDYNLNIFYFCDITPETNSMQCYSYNTESRVVSYKSFNAKDYLLILYKSVFSSASFLTI